MAKNLFRDNEVTGSEHQSNEQKHQETQHKDYYEEDLGEMMYSDYPDNPYGFVGGMMDHENNLLNTINNCENICEHMVTHVTHLGDIHMRRVQLQLLRDCADICTITAKFIARNSMFSKFITNICAYICEVCGTECFRFRDPESQHCGRICHHCARECRRFTMSMM